MRSIKRVKHLNDYKLEVEFNSGETKVVDLSNHLDGEIFEPLKKVTSPLTVAGSDSLAEIVSVVSELPKGLCALVLEVCIGKEFIPCTAISNKF